MIWENGIETYILSYVKRITSPGSMDDTGCSARLDPWFGKIPWRREWLPTVFLLGEFHEQWSLVVYRLGLERIGHD